MRSVQPVTPNSSLLTPNLLSQHYKKTYGFRVFKLGLSTGIECPKRQANDPCAFCVPNTFIDEEISSLAPHTTAGAPSLAPPVLQEGGGGGDITAQIDYLINKLKKKVKAAGYVAYFQDNTSSYGDIDYLLSLFTEATNHPQILELIVSTRPDYLSITFLEALKTISKPITIELGIQTIHNKSLQYLNRGHSQIDNQNALDLLSEYNYKVGIHIILGIPTETIQDINQTINWINKNKIINDVKIHHLAIFKDSPLSKKSDRPIDLDTYIPLLAHFITNLRDDITISRLFTSNLNRHQKMLNHFPGTKRQWLNKLQTYLKETTDA